MATNTNTTTVIRALNQTGAPGLIFQTKTPLFMTSCLYVNCQFTFRRFKPNRTSKILTLRALFQFNLWDYIFSCQFIVRVP
uniref:Uncharacterized protein n=1 Tax=Anguilla anguilla TaxID=7936 RepID=A0A0E9X4B6_ANGAN